MSEQVTSASIGIKQGNKVVLVLVMMMVVSRRGSSIDRFGVFLNGIHVELAFVAVIATLSCIVTFVVRSYGLEVGHTVRVMLESCIKRRKEKEEIRGGGNPRKSKKNRGV